jgi:hypothetical protein
MIQPLGINSHLNPVNTQWASHAMSDAALFHGVLFHASVHLESYRVKSWSSATLFHRGETIRLVSERLNDSADVVSDNTIAAVAWVASEGVSLLLGSCVGWVLTDTRTLLATLREIKSIGTLFREC